MPSPCPNLNCNTIISRGKIECPDCKTKLPICCSNCPGEIPSGKSTCPDCNTNRYSPELAKIVRVVQEMCNSSCTQDPYPVVSKSCLDRLQQGVDIICDVLNQGYCPSCNKRNPCWSIEDLRENFQISKVGLQKICDLCLSVPANGTGVEFLRHEILRIIVK